MRCQGNGHCSAHPSEEQQKMSFLWQAQLSTQRLHRIDYRWGRRVS